MWYTKKKNYVKNIGFFSCVFLFFLSFKKTL
jgi:hypothetical protein